MKAELRRLSPEERVLLRIEMLEGRARENTGEIRRLKEAFEDFVSTVTDGITRRIVPALIKGLAESMQLPAKLEIKSNKEDG